MTAQQVTEHRKRKGFKSCYAAANAYGVTPRTWQYWESGEQKINLPAQNWLLAGLPEKDKQEESSDGNIQVR